MLLVICALTNVAAIANFVGTYLGYKWCQEYSAALWSVRLFICKLLNAIRSGEKISSGWVAFFAESLCIKQ